MTISITASNAGRIQLLRTLEGHTREVGSVAFSADGRLLASGAPFDGRVWLWRVENGILLRTLEGHTGSWGSWESSVRSVAFSLDGRLLASGGGDKTVRLWGIA